MYGLIQWDKRIILTLTCALFLFSCDGGIKKDEQIDIKAMDPAALVRAAEKKQRIGAFVEAIGLLRQALKMNVDFIPAHYRMGAIYEEWGLREDAVKAYQSALKLDPNHLSSRLGLGSVYSKMVKNRLAVEEFKKVAKLRPKDKEIYFKIALEYWYLQKLPETVENYLKVIELEPAHLQAHLNLASVYEKMKNWSKTLEEIRIALKLARQNNDKYSISVAEGKLRFVEGRMNMTDKELAKKSQPPFE